MNRKSSKLHPSLFKEGFYVLNKEAKPYSTAPQDVVDIYKKPPMPWKKSPAKKISKSSLTPLEEIDKPPISQK